MDEAYCEAAQVALGKFSGTMRMMTEVYAESTVHANSYLRAVTDMLSLVPEVREQTEEEEALQIRRSVRCVLVDNLLGGEPEWWDMRQDVSSVIDRRDGSHVIYARSIPRMTREEVRTLRDDIKMFQHRTDHRIRLKAIWAR